MMGPGGGGSVSTDSFSHVVSLLQIVADPTKVQQTIEELKGHATEAARLKDEATSAATQADKDRKAVLAALDELDAKQRAFQATVNHHTSLATQLDQRQAELDQRSAGLDDREQQISQTHQVAEAEIQQRLSEANKAVAASHAE